MRKVSRASLLLATLALILGCALTYGGAQRVPAEDYAVRTDAAERLQACMERVKAYKAELGIPLSAEDRHGTGMLGEDYTPITTTIGAPDAKRTTADPNMAALCVQLLNEAGVKAGDTVGAGFSGSFPAMDLAVLCACAAMDVKIVYIASVGASTYGANQVELTLPDMVLRLAEEGYLPQPPAAFSLGGDFDCGEEMFPEEREIVRARLERSGVPFLHERDYQKNLALREQLYGERGPISCFIGVGGNITTAGLDGDCMSWGVTAPGCVKTLSKKSGLLERYNESGLPVIYLLNIKRLVSEYGLPYDPQELAPIGEGAVYYETVYPWQPAFIGAAAAAGLLLWGRHCRRRGEET